MFSFGTGHPGGCAANGILCSCMCEKSATLNGTCQEQSNEHMHLYRLLPLDSDECADDSTNDCDTHAVCTNNYGSYTCACMDGWTGNGTKCEGRSHYILVLNTRFFSSAP